MTQFRYLRGAVYILENSKVERVKVGMTINNVADRLGSVNDMWLERKVTCQICGGRRLVNKRGLISQHVVSGRLVPQRIVIGRGCPGGDALPLEKEVALAESYLENMKNHLRELSGSEKGSVTLIVKNLEKRIELYRHKNRPEGEWQIMAAFYTDCAEQVELLSHEILADRLDKLAPFGEVFSCSVSDATEAVETVLSQLGLLHSARKETRL
jgi:DNA-directed RNA polymerase subunit RPC12/RpoP